MNDLIFPLKSPVVALVGPTAIGKTALSVKLAKEFDFEIISVDSMQVYKYMDIGTAKVTTEEMEGVPHHLIDILKPDYNFDAVEFERLALQAMGDILARGKRVLLTGGTGLYLKSLVEGLSHKVPSFPKIRAEIQEKLKRYGSDALHEEFSLIDCISASRIHKNDTHRLVRGLEIYHGTGKTWSQHIKEHEESKELRFKNFLTIGLTCDRKHLYERIGLRSEIMMEAGFKEEVEGLLAMGYDLTNKSMRSIGYSHMTRHLTGEWSLDKTLELLARDTRRYAKRQYTWFNKIENIQWVDKACSQSVPGLIRKHIRSCSQTDILKS
jgi:tRNA dimethylallyltransferase